MRWFVAGANGMLGQDLCAVLEAAGHEVTRRDLPELDILEAEQCLEQVAGHDVVANCAAHTAVDRAEEEEGLAFAINAVGAANLARAAAATGAAMVQISTDYVFAGDASQPYAADAPQAPVSAYGRTKAAGEWAVRGLCPQSWVVRTAWLYGAAGPTGFPKAMKRLAAARDSLTVVSDQVGQPTWTHDLAEAIVRLVESEAPYGMWHGTGSGQCSWFDFARATFEELGLDPERVQPITSAEYAAMYPAAAARPAYSVLSHDKWAAAGIAPLPDWRDGLRRAAPTVLAD